MLKFYSCCAHSVSKNNNCTHHRMKSMLETLNELFNENCNGLHSNNLHFHTPPDINVKTLYAVFTIPCTSLEFQTKYPFEHHFQLKANRHLSSVVRVIYTSLRIYRYQK